MPADFEAYFRALAATSVDSKTEHSDRGALEALLQAAANDAEPGAHVQHEPPRDKSGGGSPDFKVTRQGRIAGYIEVKTIDENLSKVLKSDQIKKYRKLSDNIVLTDYLEFCWLKPDGETVRQRLAYSDDLTSRTLRLKPESVEAVRMLLRGFFSATPQRIGRSHDLALALASRAAMLRDFLTTELTRQQKDHTEGRLFALFQAFRDQVFHDLTIADFADAFAQMLAYGLFLARLNAGPAQTITLTNVRQFIPGSFALIRELVRFLDEMGEAEYRDIRWVIDEILSIVNGVDLDAIHSDLSFRSRKAISRKVRAGDEEEHRLFERDPFIYFYEDFLKAYDPAMRKGRGVYYTPPPVVNFIVRAVDDILKDKFGIRDGLADHRKVTVLDFAAGTGTFLLEVFERIFANIGGADAGRADQIVREHIAKNLYGFEYLIAPYTIAHLKLSQYLKDKGHPLRDDERLQVFLTNTLEPVEPQRNLLMPALSAEVEAAQRVKDQPILVILGNPPYSVESRNNGDWITKLIENYKYVDGEHFGERKHSLPDDYVKFIRFAEDKFSKVDKGIFAIISNRGYIDNVTFRGMRQSLTNTFDQIYVLDLHGAQGDQFEGRVDENVFDITTGVAIAIFVKTGSDPALLYETIGGNRVHKYKLLANGNMGEFSPVSVSPSSPNYFFVPHSVERRSDKEFSLRDIFIHNGVGVITARDHLNVGFDAKELHDRLAEFAGLEPEVARSKFALRKDVEGWSVDWAQKELKDTGLDKNLIREFSYRVFDTRSIYYTGKSNGIVSRPTFETMSNLLEDDAIALVTCRLLKREEWRHAFVSEKVLDNCLISNESKERSYAFPLWRNDGSGRIEALSPAFRDFLDARFDHHYSPEEIFGYLYAVLHAPSYRSRYAEFLRIDFPRIPFAETKAQFDALSDLGWDLVQAHLLRDVPAATPRLGVYHGKGDHLVEAVRYSPEEQAIWINKTQNFGPVPQAVWDFHIGGYQVLEKYLKSRKGRTLSLDETTHIGAVAEVLAFTIDQMARIDEAYLAAFPEQAA